VDVLDGADGSVYSRRLRSSINAGDGNTGGWF
jgi:hypothetical protein